MDPRESGFISSSGLGAKGLGGLEEALSLKESANSTILS